LDYSANLEAMKRNFLCIAGFSIALPAAIAVQAQVPDHTEFELQARTNLIVNDNGFNLPPGSSFNSVTVDMNDAAQVVFKVQVVPGFDGMSVWFGSGGVGELACDSDDDIEAIISDPKIGNSGGVVFSQFFAAANNGIWSCDPIAQTASRLTTAPLGATSWGTPELNDTGAIGYRAGFGSGQAWVSFFSGAAAIHATEVGIDVGSPYDFLFSPSFDNQRRLAGVVRVAPAAPIAQHRQIRVFTSSGSSTQIAIDSTGSAVSPFVSFDNSVALNDVGQVAFIAALTGNVRAVQRGDGNSVVEIARVGVAGLTEIEFFGPAINNTGLVAFRGRDANGQAIFVGDGLTLRRVVGKGDSLDSDLGTAEVGQNDSSPVFGGGVAINAQGDVAFTAALHPPGNNQIEWGTGVYVAYASTDTLFANGFE
jgi:hypothetical protein